MSDKLKQSIYINLLAVLHRQLQLNASHTVNALLADVCLLLFKHKKWSHCLTCAPNDNQMHTLNSSIIYMLNENKVELSLPLLTTLQTLLAQTISAMHRHEDEANGVRVKIIAADWMTPTVGLLMHSMHEFELTIGKSDTSTVETRCAVVSLTLFNAVITAAASEHAAWLPLIKNNVIIESLVQLLAALIETHKSFEVAQSVMTILIRFASDAATAHVVQSSQAFQALNSPFKSIYEQPIAPDVISKSLRPKASWSNVYHGAFSLATSMLIRLQQFFAIEAIEFVKYHAARIRECFAQLCTQPSMSLLDEALEITILLTTLTKFKHLWIARERELFNAINDDVGKICTSTAAFLRRPSLFQFVLTHPSASAAAFSDRPVTFPVQSAPVADTSSTMPSNIPKLSPTVEASLHRLLSLSLAFLVRMNYHQVTAGDPAAMIEEEHAPAQLRKVLAAGLIVTHSHARP